MTRAFPVDGAQRVFPLDDARLIPSDGLQVGPRPLPENMGLLTGVYETLARDLSNSRGVLIVTNSAIHTKGVYTELVASSSADAVGIFFQGSIGNGNSKYMIDLAIGSAGSEVIIANNLVFYATQKNIAIHDYFIPLAIPSGTRIAARVQNSDAGTDNFWVCASLLLEDDSIGLTICDTWGAVEASTTGARITPSTTAEVKGSWGEVISSTPNGVTIISLAQLQFNINLLNQSSVFDIGIGPAGSEQVIIHNIPFESNSSSDWINGGVPFFPIDIPKGSRISARTQTTSSSVPAGSDFDLIIYGYK